MSTAYYRQDSGELLGVRTFEKAGEEKPRPCFTWAVNPALYMWNAEFHLIVDEYGNPGDRDHFAREVVGACEVQRYDEKNVPA